LGTKVNYLPAAGSVEVFDLKRFDAILEKDISGYDGEFSQIIHQAPALYKMMTRLLDDRALPRSMSPLVIAAIAYFILPEDIIPEEKYGPVGYVDDIYLCAFVANEVAKKSASPDILIRNWDGNVPVVALIKEILDREKELISDKKDRIMQYIGYDQLGMAPADSID
jgi:uncharacterized membrane protein YkvA (DUF1232 family)